jgi:hypothetical protein
VVLNFHHVRSFSFNGEPQAQEKSSGLPPNDSINVTQSPIG